MNEDKQHTTYTHSGVLSPICPKHNVPMIRSIAEVVDCDGELTETDNYFYCPECDRERLMGWESHRR